MEQDRFIVVASTVKGERIFRPEKKFFNQTEALLGCPVGCRVGREEGSLYYLKMSNEEEEESASPEVGGLANLQDGLHPDTYALLMQFLPHGRFLAEEGEDEEEGITDKTVCVAYRPEDVDVISATLSRLASKHDERETREKKAASERVLLQLEGSSGEGDEAYEALMAEGVVRLNGVLSHAHCDALLLSINAKLALDISSDNPFTCETGYGNVLCREHRWDMYLRNEGVYLEALTSMLLGDAHSPLGRLIGSLFEGTDCGVHEFSALICDRGANTQPIHPDTMVSGEFTRVAPMYTLFIALQDIDETMGATIFLPRTNTQHCK